MSDQIFKTFIALMNENTSAATTDIASVVVEIKKAMGDKYPLGSNVNHEVVKRLVTRQGCLNPTISNSIKFGRLSDYVNGMIVNSTLNQPRFDVSNAVNVASYLGLNDNLSGKIVDKYKSGMTNYMLQTTLNGSANVVFFSKMLKAASTLKLAKGEDSSIPTVHSHMLAQIDKALYGEASASADESLLEQALQSSVHLTVLSRWAKMAPGLRTQLGLDDVTPVFKIIHFFFKEGYSITSDNKEKLITSVANSADSGLSAANWVIEIISKIKVDEVNEVIANYQDHVAHKTYKAVKALTSVEGGSLNLSGLLMPYFLSVENIAMPLLQFVSQETLNDVCSNISNLSDKDEQEKLKQTLMLSQIKKMLATIEVLRTAQVIKDQASAQMRRVKEVINSDNISQESVSRNLDLYREFLKNLMSSNAEEAPIAYNNFVANSAFKDSFAGWMWHTTQVEPSEYDISHQKPDFIADAFKTILEGVVDVSLVTELPHVNMGRSWSDVLSPEIDMQIASDFSVLSTNIPELSNLNLHEAIDKSKLRLAYNKLMKFGMVMSSKVNNDIRNNAHQMKLSGAYKLPEDVTSAIGAKLYAIETAICAEMEILYSSKLFCDVVPLMVAHSNFKALTSLRSNDVTIPPRQLEAESDLNKLFAELGIDSKGSGVVLVASSNLEEDTPSLAKGIVKGSTFYDSDVEMLHIATTDVRNSYIDIFTSSNTVANTTNPYMLQESVATELVSSKTAPIETSSELEFNPHKAATSLYTLGKTMVPKVKDVGCYSVFNIVTGLTSGQECCFDHHQLQSVSAAVASHMVASSMSRKPLELNDVSRKHLVNANHMSMLYRLASTTKSLAYVHARQANNYEQKVITLSTNIDLVDNLLNGMGIPPRQLIHISDKMPCAMFNNLVSSSDIFAPTFDTLASGTYLLRDLVKPKSSIKKMFLSNGGSLVAYILEKNSCSIKASSSVRSYSGVDCCIVNLDESHDCVSVTPRYSSSLSNITDKKEAQASISVSMKSSDPIFEEVNNSSKAIIIVDTFLDMI